MRAMTYSINKRQRGMTMVELLVAMLLAVILGAAVVSAFVANSHSFNQDENILRMQDDARHALRELSFAVSMAGHYGELLVPAAITNDDNLTVGTDCGSAGVVEWVYRTVTPGTTDSLSVTTVDNATAAQANASHSCIQAGEFEAGTDVISIKRVSGARSGATTAGRVYLRTNGTVGLLYKAPAPATPDLDVPLPRAEWEYRPSIFFIRNYANSPGDEIPTLCKKVLRGNSPGMITECLATGIENLQIEYGIDTSGDSNPNLFLPSPTVAQMQGVVSARIFLLARTTDLDIRYENDKTYNISNAPAFQPDDSFHRRIFSTTVTIQNIRSLSAMGF
jgi:type IV pilus assembly protein PilW